MGSSITMISLSCNSWITHVDAPIPCSQCDLVLQWVPRTVSNALKSIQGLSHIHIAWQFHTATCGVQDNGCLINHRGLVS